MELVFNSVDKFAFHVKSGTMLIFNGSVLTCYGKFNDCNNTYKKRASLVKFWTCFEF